MNLEHCSPARFISPSLTFLGCVQDWPGRTGLWSVGVPPSGPMDPLAFRYANALVGNGDGEAGLEFAIVGPTLRFHAATTVRLFGVCGRGHLAIQGLNPAEGCRSGLLGIRYSKMVSFVSLKITCSYICSTC